VQAPRAPDQECVVSSRQLLIYAISRSARVVGDRNTGDQDVRLVEFAEFLELNMQRPADVVLSPMVGDTYDCIDVAQHLCDAGFTGSYRVMTPDLPDPGILRQEIRSLCPGLDFDLVELRTLSESGSN
jgi:hypothetical protein